MMYLNQTFKQAVLKIEQENKKAGVIFSINTVSKKQRNSTNKTPQEINGSLVIALLSKGFYNFLATFIFDF